MIDLGTTEFVAVSAGPPLTGTDVVAALERGAQERGVRPLVFQSDRGKENTCAVTEAYLESHRIVHLRNVPRTPEHNPNTERCHRDLKSALAVPAGSAGLVLDRAVWRARVFEARDFENHGLRRESLGGLTAAEYSQTVLSWYDEPDHESFREAFYETTHKAVAEALRGVESAHARQVIERETKLAVMEQFNLIRRTRSDAFPRRRKPEGIS